MTKTELTKVLSLATMAAFEYLDACEIFGTSNLVNFETWVETAANSHPEVALVKGARKVFVRKATESFKALKTARGLV